MHNKRVVSLSCIHILTEGYSLGDSLSVATGNCSKEIGRTSLYMIFGWEYMWSSTHLSKRLLLLTKAKCLQLMILVLFWVRGDAEIWLPEILPEICT